MKNLHFWKRYVWGMGALCLSVAAIGISVAPASAQPGRVPITAQQAIHNLKANYGVMIIPRDGVDLNTMVNASVTTDTDVAPSIAVARLASAMNARARMVFIVLPASADRPVTTLSDARSFDDAGGTVTLSLSGLPADSAIRTVAAADNAVVDLRSDVGNRTIDLDGANMGLAEAIAKIAAQTNTHWIQAYELLPAPAPTLARAPQFHRAQSLVTMSTDAGPTGPVYFHPAPPPPPPAAQPTPPANDQGTNNSQTNQPAQGPANPNDGLPPYYVMQNGYGYENGVPYPQTWGGFSYGGFAPNPGFVVNPSFGGWYGGGPIVFGGGTTTTTPF